METTYLIIKSSVWVEPGVARNLLSNIKVEPIYHTFISSIICPLVEDMDSISILVKFFVIIVLHDEII